MLSHLDRIIFPDRCEVIEVIPSQRYVYPIFKNGSTTLYWAAREQGWKIKFNEQIQKLTSIDIVLRDPEQRFVSGISTFVQHVLRDNTDLDPATVLWFAKNYLFLNRHYAPQFLWLVNLSRYLAPDIQLNFIGMEDIASITPTTTQPLGIEPATTELVAEVLNLPNNQMYQQLDQAVFNCIGQTMTFGQLAEHLQAVETEAYNYVVGNAQKILNALPKT